MPHPASCPPHLPPLPCRLPPTAAQAWSKCVDRERDAGSDFTEECREKVGGWLAGWDAWLGDRVGG